MICWLRYTINGWLWHTVFSAFFHHSRKSFEQQSIKGNSHSCYSYPIIQLLSLQNSGNGWKRRSSSFSSVWSSICKSTKVPTYGILYKKPGPLLLEQKTLSNLFLYLLRKGIIILLFVCVLCGVFVSVKLTKNAQVQMVQYPPFEQLYQLANPLQPRMMRYTQQNNGPSPKTMSDIENFMK